MTAVVHAARRRLRRDDRVDRDAWYAARWSVAAGEGGWDIEWVDGGFTELRRDGATLRVRGSDVGIDTYLTYRIAGNKGITGRRLGEAGVPIVDSTEFGVLDVRAILDHVSRDPRRYVLKPAAGTGGGAGVTVSPSDRRMVLRSLRDAGAFSRRVRVDERIDGRVARVLILRDRVLDAVVRTPAAVTGDGRSTIGELVRTENERRRRLGPAATGFIGLGTDHHAALRRAGLSSSAVPAEGQCVVAAGRSNTGSELESTRIDLGPEAADVARRAAQAVGVQLAGVDVVLDDTGAALAVLEVNTGPGLHWHVLTSNDPFDPFRAILDDVARR